MTARLAIAMAKLTNRKVYKGAYLWYRYMTSHSLNPAGRARNVPVSVWFHVTGYPERGFEGVSAAADGVTDSITLHCGGLMSVEGSTPSALTSVPERGEVRS